MKGFLLIVAVFTAVVVAVILLATTDRNGWKKEVAEKINHACLHHRGVQEISRVVVCKDGYVTTW